MRGRRATWTVAATAVITAVWAAPSQAVVTIGSTKLAQATDVPASCGATPCVVSQAVLPGQQITSPVNGTIVRWRTQFSGSGMARLRVIRPMASGPFFALSSSTVPVLATTTEHATRLSVEIGDRIGVEDRPGAGGQPRGYTASASAFIESWSFSPSDGAISPATGGGFGVELALNADIDPRNSFSFGDISRNKKKGTATLSVTVPNAGELALSGKGVRQAGSAGARVAVAVTTPGEVGLKIRATGKKRKVLNKRGKVKLSVAVTFTPTGGTGRTQLSTVKLRKN